MQSFVLLSRFSQEDMGRAIGCPEASVHKNGILLRFEDESTAIRFEARMKVEGLINLGNIHGLLGRGDGLFLSSWFFIPGLPNAPCWNSTVVIAIPFRGDQSFKQLQLVLEDAVVKVLEPAAM
jgi:hypothetical protein